MKLSVVIPALNEAGNLVSTIDRILAALDSRDPNTTEATREAVLAHGRELQRAWGPLFRQAMGEAGADRELVEYAFLTLRGYLMGNMLTAAYATASDKQTTRDLLVRGVACAIAERAEERGIALG